MLKYEILTDRVSSVVEMAYNDKSGKLIEERKVFLNPAEADLYVKNRLTDYLKIKLRLYVHHAWKLGIVSQSPKYSREERTMAINFLLDYVRDFKGHNCFGIAAFIRANNRTLETVLPVINNSSYGSSKRNFDELTRLSTLLK